MSKKDTAKADIMRDEYNFTGKKASRGRYARSYREGHTVRIYNGEKLISDEFFAAIDSDVREYFSDSKAINKALRALISVLPEKPRSARR